jgi:transglutaminase-like putative cysteine protease
MARELQEAPRSHRLIQLGAVALASSAAAIAFGRVFSGRATTWKLVLVGLVSIALAAAFERRSPLLAALVSAVGLLWTLGLLVFPHTLWHGLPLGSTVHAIGHSLGRVGHQADIQVAPTPALRPLFMAAVTAVWTAAFSTHALAIRSGSPLLAAAPAAALVAFAGVVLEDGPRPGYAVLFLLGVLALLFADGLRRVRQWGPVRPWTSGIADVRRRMVSASTTRGARRVAVTVVGVALLLPGLLPGLSSKPVLKLGNGGSEINPLVSVSSSLKLRNPIPLFSVHVPIQDGVYWRWLSLDRFDGDEWTAGDMDVERGKTYGAEASLPYTVQSLPDNTPATFLSATVTIVHTPGKWLPLPYEPFDVSTPGSTFRFDASHTAAVPDQALDPGFTYRVDARVVEPTYEQLDHTFDYSGRQYRRNLQLPESLPEEIPALARAIVKRAGARSTLEQALAVQRYLTDPLVFQYDATVQQGDGNDALKDFLFTTHRGFCQQFASAMAVLLRALGIPARVAVGFTPGKYDGHIGAFEVTTQNAHSWVEAEFPGFGWVPFEPTPTRSNPVTEHIVFSKPINGLPPEQDGCNQEQFVRGACGNTGGKDRGNTQGGGVPGKGGHKNPMFGEPPPRSEEPVVPIPRGPINLGKAPQQPSTPVSWRLVVGIGLLAAAGLVLVLFPLLKIAVRRVRVARARGSRDRTLAAFRLFEARAGDVGLGRGPGETPLEYRTRISHEVQLSDGHLDRLASAATSAAYAPRSVSDDEADGARRDGRVAIRDVRRSVGVTRRLTGLWRPQI